MPRGPKKHLKRLAAPKAWMLAKLGGAFTIKSSSGPHKQSASLPITLFIRLALLIVARSGPCNGLLLFLGFHFYNFIMKCFPFLKVTFEIVSPSSRELLYSTLHLSPLKPSSRQCQSYICYGSSQEISEGRGCKYPCWFLLSNQLQFLFFSGTV